MNSYIMIDFTVVFTTRNAAKKTIPSRKDDAIEAIEPKKQHDILGGRKVRGWKPFTQPHPILPKGYTSKAKSL